jgi:hypothetical protein
VSDVQLPDGVTTDIDLDTPVAMGSPTRSTIILQQTAAREAAGEDPSTIVIDDEI